MHTYTPTTNRPDLLIGNRWQRLRRGLGAQVETAGLIVVVLLTGALDREAPSAFEPTISLPRRGYRKPGRLVASARAVIS